MDVIKIISEEVKTEVSKEKEYEQSQVARNIKTLHMLLSRLENNLKKGKKREVLDDAREIKWLANEIYEVLLWMLKKLTSC